MQKVNEYGLIADDSEINKKIDENFNKAGMTTDKAKSLCDNFRIIYEALIELHKDPSKVDDIYSKRLENIISKDQWKLFQICYNTPEKLKNFLIPKDIDDMKKNSYESTVKDVLYEKLESIITKNIDVTDDEITEAYHKIYDQLAEKPKLEDMKQKLHNDLILKKEQEAKMLWWQEQYKQANIKIIDSQFRGAQNLLYSTIKMQDNNHDEKNEE